MGEIPFFAHLFACAEWRQCVCLSNWSRIFVFQKNPSKGNMKTYFCHCCYLMIVILSKLVEKTLETNLNLCELGVINYKKDYGTYDSYKNTSYLVEETNNHTISSDNSIHWAKVTLTVKNNTNCCLKITDTSAHFENPIKCTIELNVTRCICGYLTIFFEKMPK